MKATDILGVLVGMDTMQTYIGLRMGLIEQNPALGWLMAKYGLVMMLTAKAALSAIMVWILAWTMKRFKSEVVGIVTHMVLGVYGVVVCWNSALLWGLIR